MNAEDYFISLSKYGQNFLNKLPIEKKPQPLNYCLVTLDKAIKEIKSCEIGELADLWKFDLEKRKNSSFDEVAGLNTVGMLCDRFTILIVKEWCLRNKHNSGEKADQLFETQTMEIVKSLARVKPGYSSINSKITNIKTDINVSSWDEAFFELLATNLLLWESQEVLYIKDITTLPYEELRDYIKWFAIGNMRRNVLIELCESNYWKKYDES